MQTGLANAKQEEEQANARITELETSVNETKSLPSQLEQANAEIERLKNEIEQNAAPPVSVTPPETDNSMRQLQ